jgi:error-prone DNA polymerase
VAETQIHTRESPPSAGYVELHAHSSFSFLDGASSPEELVDEAVELGLAGLALTDHDGMSGVVRFASAARDAGLPTIFGAELGVDVALPAAKTERAIAARAGVPDPPGRHLLVLARDPAGYASLCRVISRAQLRGGAKGRPQYDWDELAEAAAGHWLVLTGCRKGPVRAALEAGALGTFALDPARAALAELVVRFGRDNVAVELTYAREPLAFERYDALTQLAGDAGLPVVATTAAHYHAPPRRRLATVMAAVRARSSLDEINGWLPAWADAHLRSHDEMVARFSRRWPGVVEAAGRLGAELAFDLELIAPHLPPFPVPAGRGDEMAYLRELTYIGALRRYGPRGPATERAYGVLEHELGIIEQLGFPGYFLIVWELVEFCRREGIMCQGRGSAANSAVCYALGVTAVDAVRYGLLFERFLSPERDGPPDIDIDIESDRREEVIQHVYATHGREYAAQVANVITYRPPSAIRDVAKALGYSPGPQDAWSKQVERHYWTRAEGAALEGNDAGAGDNIPDLVLELAGELQHTPRHLGIHSGGIVICDRPIIEVCPVEWARMANRSVLQWDKDDCAKAGLTKFDLLGLGMLSALRYTFEFVEAWHGRKLELYDIPADDPLVYDMLCRADTVGVFQIESRAQMSTLPRLKPGNFYDLAIEIALIRPGPIQGDSVHPYLRRRDGEEPITYPHPDLERVLKKTLGVPLFQEQLMQLAVVAAGFSPGEADTLRRAMGSKRSVERMEALRQRLYDGMAAKGITGAAADDIWEKIKSFAAFGFPESHSISFAFLAIASSWLKLYHPAAFLAGLLNAQPMGFYTPQSLVHDARRHGIEVRGVDINASGAGAVLEHAGPSGYAGPGPRQPAVRIGLSSVRTISKDLAAQIASERDDSGAYATMADLSRRIGLTTDQVEALATAGAFDHFGLTRRVALWAAGSAAGNRPGQLDITPDAGSPTLRAMTEPEQLVADLWATGISRDHYPTALIRDRLDDLGVTPAAQLATLENRTRVLVGGIVTHRQRPPSAGGVTFISLEDETGLINIIVPQTVWARHRRVARDSGALLIRGMLERAHDVTNVMAERIDKLPLGTRPTSRDFR